MAIRDSTKLNVCALLKIALGTSMAVFGEPPLAGNGWITQAMGAWLIGSGALVFLRKGPVPFIVIFNAIASTGFTLYFPFHLLFYGLQLEGTELGSLERVVIAFAATIPYLLLTFICLFTLVFLTRCKVE